MSFLFLSKSTDILNGTDYSKRKQTNWQSPIPMSNQPKATEKKNSTQKQCITSRNLTKNTQQETVAIATTAISLVLKPRKMRNEKNGFRLNYFSGGDIECNFNYSNESISLGNVCIVCEWVIDTRSLCHLNFVLQMGRCKCAYCVDSTAVVSTVMNVALNVTFTKHNWPFGRRHTAMRSKAKRMR